MLRKPRLFGPGRNGSNGVRRPHRRPHRWIPTADVLEQRRVLDCTVNNVAGTLVIVGDATNNDIAVFAPVGFPFFPPGSGVVACDGTLIVVPGPINAVIGFGPGG